jgi:rare lipoprotein A
MRPWFPPFNLFTNAGGSFPSGRGLLRSIAIGCVILASGCTSAPRFVSNSAPPIPSSGVHELTGIASYYAEEFNGRKTANGEVFDMNELTAAHRTLPFQTIVVVRNLDNGKDVQVRINDRGPFVGGRVIDLSLEAARQLDMLGSGTARVSLEVLETPQKSQ